MVFRWVASEEALCLSPSTIHCHLAAHLSTSNFPTTIMPPWLCLSPVHLQYPWSGLSWQHSGSQVVVTNKRSSRRYVPEVSIERLLEFVVVSSA